MKRWFIHNSIQMVLPFLVATFAILFNRSLDSTKALIAAGIGGFLPDVDHLNIWREYKFKNFIAFLVFCFTSNRYRKSFQIFHTFYSIIVLIALLPLTHILNIYLGIFLLSFLVHLFFDFFDDKIAIKSLTHWKILKVH